MPESCWVVNASPVIAQAKVARQRRWEYSFLALWASFFVLAPKVASNQPALY
jgi:hypothetical protein